MTNLNPKKPYECSVPATRVSLERMMRALVSTGSHFTNSWSLGSVDVPSSNTVFLRVWVHEGSQSTFEEMAKVRVQV